VRSFGALEARKDAKGRGKAIICKTLGIANRPGERGIQTLIWGKRFQNKKPKRETEKGDISMYHADMGGR